MTEDEAKIWLSGNLNVPHETMDRLEQYIALLLAEMPQQNLISKASAEEIWSRHIVDSAQLLKLVPDIDRSNQKIVWLDLGTGAGLPGIIIAILCGFKVICVESRSRRVEFLSHVIAELKLNNCEVREQRLELVDTLNADIISARAFAPLPKLIAISHRFSTGNTIWLLPKGKNAVRELEELPAKQRKMFHVEQSLTDADAKILVGTGVIRPN